MRFTDVEFSKDSGYYDLSIDDDGDLSKTNSFCTAILLSIFCERRASATEVPEGGRRRGWIGSINQPVEYGSKLWLLYQARLTNRTVNAANDYLSQGLSWLTEFDYADEIIVNTSRDIEQSRLDADIQVIVNGSVLEKRNVTLWGNTVCL